MWSNSGVNASPYNVPHMVRFSEGTSKPLEIHRVCMSQPRQNPLLCFPLCCAGCSANYDLKQILVCFLNLLVNTCCVQLIFPGTFSLVLRKERWTSVALWGTRRLHCFLQERMLCSYLRIGAGGLVWLLCIRQKRLWCFGSQSVRTSPHVGGSPDPVLNTYLLYDIHSPLDKIPERSWDTSSGI